jgi:hypothetical protein
MKNKFIISKLFLNEMFMWVGTGDFQLNSNGVPQISAEVNMPIARLIISRYHGRNGTWRSSQTSFILSNWKIDSDNMYITWGCTRTDANIDVTGSVTASKQNGISASLNVKVGVRNSVEAVHAMSYDKCFVLRNNIDQLNQAFGFRYQYPIYGFGKVRSFFQIETL